MNGIVILLDEVRGIHIPRDFARECLSLPGWTGVDEETREILLAGYEHEHYWEAWDDVLGSATFTALHGFKYALHQDGTLFAYCLERMTLEEKEGLGFDIVDDLREILDAHPDYAVLQDDVTGNWSWRGPETHSLKVHYSFPSAALECINANDLELNPSF
jgi:hypothetical protein